MVKVISRTSICGVLYLQNIIKCKGQFAYITYSHRQFLENNHALLLSRGKSQYNPPGIQGTYDTAQHREVTNLWQIFQYQGLRHISWTRTLCHHYWELPNHAVMMVNWASRNTDAPKSIIVAQRCMRVIYLEVDTVLLTSWIALKRLQSKFVSSKARSQVLIPKILTDFCCNSSFSANGF